MTLRSRSLFTAAFFLIVISITVSLQFDNSDFASAKEIIVMRKIGHQILLSSGDTRSLVLPIKKLGENQYQIRFERPLKFTPDSMVRIIRQGVETNKLPKDYIVNVIESQKNQVIYGFATNLVSCIGRPLPKAFYSINITFRKSGLSNLNKYYFAGAAGLAALMLLFIGLTINYRERSAVKCFVQTPLIKSVIPIGNYLFHKDEKCLEYNLNKIQLSDIESKLLFILASNPNGLIERSALQKVWEDEGVIVGRSLDMFISKLRKKLQTDPTVRLVNIHGKGYKMEII